MNWKFKEEIPDSARYSEEFWYDITLGGYINPREILDDKEQIKKLLEAVAIVQSFENALEDLNPD